MESNLFLEPKINNKSLRLDGSFDPKFYFSTAFFVSGWNREELVKNQDNSLLILSLSGLKKAGTQLPTFTASIDYKQSTLIILEIPETCGNRVSENANR